MKSLGGSMKSMSGQIHFRKKPRKIPEYALEGFIKFLFNTLTYEEALRKITHLVMKEFENETT